MTSRCTATNTTTGAPCRAWPLRGTDRCISHSDKVLQESTGFGGRQPAAGRPRNPRPSEVARHLIESNVLALQRPYWLALGYDVEAGPEGPYLVKRDDGGVKLHATFEGRVSVSRHEDLAAMMAAAEKLQDRVYGRPTQATEISGPGGGPVQVLDAAGEDGRRALRDVLGSRAPARDR